LRLPRNGAEKNEDLARNWRKLWHKNIRYNEGDEVKEDDVAATSHHLGAMKTPKEFWSVKVKRSCRTGHR